MDAAASGMAKRSVAMYLSGSNHGLAPPDCAILYRHAGAFGLGMPP